MKRGENKNRTWSEFADQITTTLKKRYNNRNGRNLSKDGPHEGDKVAIYLLGQAQFVVKKVEGAGFILVPDLEESPRFSSAGQGAAFAAACAMLAESFSETLKEKVLKENPNWQPTHRIRRRDVMPADRKEIN